jgi:hexokinase
MDTFQHELEKGLGASTNIISDLKMYPTFVYELPTGKETGDILALDLGGSNFRVALIKLRGNAKPVMENKAFILSESLLRG